MKPIGPSGIALRFVFALLLVLCTYNPSGYSWFHWIKSVFPAVTPVIAISGIALIIGWAIYIRATLRSLGPVGLLLAAVLFACLIWLLIDWGVLSLEKVSAIAWVVLIILAALLATGMSWSHIRRRMSGQVDADDVDEN